MLARACSRTRPRGLSTPPFSVLEKHSIHPLISLSPEPPERVVSEDSGIQGSVPYCRQMGRGDNSKV